MSASRAFWGFASSRDGIAPVSFRSTRVIFGSVWDRCSVSVRTSRKELLHLAHLLAEARFYPEIRMSRRILCRLCAAVIGITAAAAAAHAIDTKNFKLTHHVPKADRKRK